MDRQTKIAFGLIFLLLIAYFAYMSRFGSPAPPQGAATDSLASPLTRVDDGFGLPADAVPPPRGESIPPAKVVVRRAMPAAERRQIVVETQRARYLLDSKGALVRSIELKEFAGIASKYVELVDSTDAGLGLPTGALGVDFDLASGELSSADWDFRVDLPPGEDEIRLRAGQEMTIEFSAADGDGGELVKRYTFFGGRYEFQLRVSAALGGGLESSNSIGIDWGCGLLSTERNQKDDLNSFNNMFRVGEQETKKSRRNFKDGQPERSEEGTVQWVATKSKYFLAALVPEDLLNGRAVLTGDSDADVLGWRAEYPLSGRRTSFDENFRVYAGPLVYDDLKVYDRGLEHLVDMGKLIRPISLAIKWLMDFLSRFIPNYGIIIILLSVFTKLAFYRLTHKSFKSMKDMQAVQPELKALQEKHKNNKEQLNKATMELYKKHGVNPLGGCLPLLLQMPVFFALYRVLRAAVELRGAGFVGWIDDLSNMDVIYRFPFDIPLVGGFIENSISVLPILMGLSMWAQQKMGGTGMGTVDSPAAGQMAAMNKIMPFFMTFIFYRMPSGLVLYWLVNNVLTAVQQYYIRRGSDDAPKVVTAEATGAKP